MISKKHLFFKAKLRLKHENSLFKIAKNIFSGLPVVIFFLLPLRRKQIGPNYKRN